MRAGQTLSWELCRDVDMVADTERRGLEWIGHVVRTE